MGGEGEGGRRDTYIYIMNWPNNDPQNMVQTAEFCEGILQKVL